MLQNPVKPDDSRRIISALVDIATAARRLSNTVVGTKPEASSSAAEQLNHPLNLGPSWRGESPVRRAHEDIYFACLAAYDHMLAYADTIGAPRMLTVSLASLSRSGIEAFARANWLLESGDAIELLQRHAAFASADLKFLISLQPREALSTWGGEPIDPTEY